MSNDYKQFLTLSGDPAQLPHLQDKIETKAAELAKALLIHPKSLEITRPETMNVTFETRKLREDLPAYVESLIGPDNEFPSVWMDVEVTDICEMYDCFAFANEDLRQVKEWIAIARSRPIARTRFWRSV
jgi:hypothetical protein